MAATATKKEETGTIRTKKIHQVIMAKFDDLFQPMKLINFLFK